MTCDLLKESKDDIVATTTLKFSQIQNDPEWRNPRWVNFYGVPSGTTVGGPTMAGKLGMQMSQGLLPGTAYRGRVLLSANSKKDSTAKVTIPSISILSIYTLYINHIIL